MKYYEISALELFFILWIFSNFNFIFEISIRFFTIYGLNLLDVKFVSVGSLLGVGSRKSLAKFSSFLCIESFFIHVVSERGYISLIEEQSQSSIMRLLMIFKE